MAWLKAGVVSCLTILLSAGSVDLLGSAQVPAQTEDRQAPWSDAVAASIAVRTELQRLDERSASSKRARSDAEAAFLACSRFASSTLAKTTIVNWEVERKKVEEFAKFIGRSLARYEKIRSTLELGRLQLEAAALGRTVYNLRIRRLAGRYLGEYAEPMAEDVLPAYKLYLDTIDSYSAGALAAGGACREQGDAAEIADEGFVKSAESFYDRIRSKLLGRPQTDG